MVRLSGRGRDRRSARTVVVREGACGAKGQSEWWWWNEVDDDGWEAKRSSGVGWIGPVDMSDHNQTGAVSARQAVSLRSCAVVWLLGCSRQPCAGVTTVGEAEPS